MPLPRHLENVTFNYPCPQCGHLLGKKGSWFRTMAGFTCESCRTPVRITYDIKLKLFADYARKAAAVQRGEFEGGKEASSKGHAGQTASTTLTSR